MTASILYAKDLYEHITIEAISSVFCEALRRGVNKPGTPVSTIELSDRLDALRELGLLDVQKVECDYNSTIIDFFRKQVIATPDAPAVQDSTMELSYSDLYRQANRLAARLQQRNLTQGAMVGLLAPRSCYVVIAFIGIFKAGLAYMPLDVEVPVGRLEMFLSNIDGHRLVLTGDQKVPAFELENVECVPIADMVSTRVVDPAPHKAKTSPAPTSLAYVVFTSGSTGKPKGIKISHRNIVNSITQQPSYGNVAHVSSLAFDVSIYEMCSALCYSHKLVTS